MTLPLANEHLLCGRLQHAAAAAMELLASDSASSAALLLLRIRYEQGWLTDVVQLARERFVVSVPSTHHDRVAALRFHVARVIAGDAPAEVLRAMYGIAEAARDVADLPLEALAMELIGKTSLVALHITGSVEHDAAFLGFYRRAAEIHDHLRDPEAAITTRLRLASALSLREPQEASAIAHDAASQAAAMGRPHLALQARLKMASFVEDGPTEELRNITAEAIRLDLPLIRGRALSRINALQLDRGTFDDAAVASIASIFGSEGSLIDLHEFWGDVARKTYALGHFAFAVAAAREAVAMAMAMPFPHGEINARTTLKAALQEHGELLGSVIEDEKIRASPLQHRMRPYLNDLLSAGFDAHVKQSERAVRRVTEVVAELQPENQADLSTALYYLSIANVDLGRWDEVAAALEKSIAADEARGDWLAGISKRIELANWRVKAEWRRHGSAPPGVVDDALRELEAAEHRLSNARTPAAERQLMLLHQARSMIFQAAGRMAEALQSLATFGELADRLGSRVYVRNFHTQAGLLLHDLAQRGNVAAAAIAQPHLDEALRQWKETVGADRIANAAYLAAANERLLVRYDPANSEHHRARVRELLAESDRHIALLQTRYVEPGAEAAQKARIALHGQWSKVYELAVEFFWHDLHDANEAFSWIEKWKGRAFAVTLGVRRLPVPPGVPDEIVDAEREALEVLARAGTFQDVAAASERLRELWAGLAAIPEAAEYADLRAGRPISFAELVALLADEERRLA